MGNMPNTLYTPPIFPQLCIYFIIKNCQIIFPKGVYRTPPENAFINVYFYFYCVVKCRNRALGINERIKKIFSDTKTNPNHHCCEVIEGPAGDPNQKDFKKESPWANYIVMLAWRHEDPFHHHRFSPFLFAFSMTDE
jgi:hypothetical protein